MRTLANDTLPRQTQNDVVAVGTCDVQVDIDVLPAHGECSKRRFHPLSALGPGLITGAADDDPSGIATYSQAGARFGLQMLWTMVLTFPFMAVFQTICARIGRVTGRGLAANIKLAFPRWIVLPVVGLLLVANTLNIAADVAVMGDATQLVIGGNRHVYTCALAVVSLLLQVLVPYHRYVRFLKWLTLVLFAYVGVAFAVHVPWRTVVREMFWPHLPLDRRAAILVVAVFGTTISPYLFFWQSSEEVEEIHTHRGARPLVDDPAAATSELARIGWDTYGGMLYSNAVGFFIMLGTATTLHAAGITKIETAADAARALQPVADGAASALFALGIIGTGLLALPILAGSAAYAWAEAFGWKSSLESPWTEAYGFYGIITLAFSAGIVFDYSGIHPIAALVWTAVVNGVAAVPLMIVIMLVASRRSIMGAFTLAPVQRIAGWLVTALMAAASVLMFSLA